MALWIAAIGAGVGIVLGPLLWLQVQDLERDVKKVQETHKRVVCKEACRSAIARQVERGLEGGGRQSGGSPGQQPGPPAGGPGNGGGPPGVLDGVVDELEPTVECEDLAIANQQLCG